jgi:radical SAM family uncharacterized protein/radical SAM-linked protein
MSLNLASFRKPSRYIGDEVNSVRRETDVKVALCFPDIYDIGMSHIGLKILYMIINSMSFASAERVFAPWTDLEEYLRHNGIPLTSLEKKRPLKDFNIVGFTLQYELSYTNVLNMLDLGGLPVRSAERTNVHPIVIAGGPCAVNPLPMKPFIDAFVIGDGEEIIIEIMELYNAQNPGENNNSREDLLKELSKLDGLYVPSVHTTAGKRIRRRFIDDLDTAPFPISPVVPYTSIVHDRVAIEISRGCTKGCRFCQAGMIYRPLRERSPDNVLSLAQRSILNTGHEEISFTSLSAGDYSHLHPLIRDFNRLCNDRHISVSLPSLRVGSISSDILKEIKSVRKTGFTIAPEAGTSRLRNVINKDFTEEEYIRTLEKLFTEGWENLKLYFMIGLPSETPQDIDGIIKMVQTASGMGRKISGSRININIGISAFVPKPHTPFQWIGQASFNKIRETQDHLKKSFRRKGLNFKGQHVEPSLLEAVLARGDEDCAALIERAWMSGCRFDAWSEHFSFDKWLSASEKMSLDLYTYAPKSYDLNNVLPWSFIDSGITDDFLKLEYRRAFNGEVTSDCNNGCYGCGLKCRSEGESAEKVINEPDRATIISSKLPGHQDKVTRKFRVRFSKTGNLRNLSHQEMMTSILRAIRRANISLIYSSGFHPHPRISFGPALPTGVEGLNEYFDIEVSVAEDVMDLLKRLNSELPQGLQALEILPVPMNKSSLNDIISCYEYEVGIDDSAKSKLNDFLNLSQSIVSRKNTPVDIRPMVKSAGISGSSMLLTIVDTESKARVHEILKEIFQTSIEETTALPVKRVRLYGYNIKDKVNPMNKEKVWAER